MLRSAISKQLLLGQMASTRCLLAQYPCRHFPRKKNRNRDEMTFEDVDKMGGRPIHKEQLMAKLSKYKVKPVDQESLAFHSVRSKKEMELLRLQRQELQQFEQSQGGQMFDT